MKTLLLASALSLIAMINSTAEAKVLDAAAHGFTIEISIETQADIKTAYNQFLNVGDWWNSDHTWFGDANRMYIEPSVNGCFCEIDGERQAIHMTVSYVDPYKEVRMIGGLGPLQMMGIHGGMSWKFDTLENGNTRVTHRYQVTGYSKDGLDKLAAIVDSVQTIQLKGLQAALEK
ncbi:SRPBCC domain-containing protein [Kangiella sp. TOML190]|uniref:SRPBCC domain-containing protein n=1 Tax=Kangiella sp. TOML190 TaxID=2931351 RepID=UPI00203E1CDF|nr:SRPBCC domain-containing protein [Kangiella sp. TOML190]